MSFFTYTIIGFIIAILIWIYFALLTINTFYFTTNVTLLEILLYVDSRDNVYSVKAFLVIFFFTFSHKTGLYIMFTKRHMFDFLLEWQYRGISQEKLYERLLRDNVAGNPLYLKNNRTYEEDYPSLHKTSSVILLLIITAVSLPLIIYKVDLFNQVFDWHKFRYFQ